MTAAPVLETQLPGWPVRRGKVRDVYDLGERLLIVATDRVSAFDWVLPNGIRDKGRILTQLSRFWFDRLGVNHHLLTTDASEIDAIKGLEPSLQQALQGRVMLVRKARVAPVECVVRGYLLGTGWKEYQKSPTVWGVTLPAGLPQAAKLPEPIFTPTTKAEEGHDENISFERMAELIGMDSAETLRALSLDVYRRGAEHAQRCGLILADTKFEWGQDQEGNWLLVDEVLTPDSSRYWPADAYRPGTNPPSFDKQFIRDWLEGCGWDKQSPPPALPAEIVVRSREKYIEAYERLTGQPFAGG